MSGIDALFTPFHCKSLHLPNRVVMAPMTRNFSPGNVPGENVAAYYRRRAEGGTGLIITEGTCVGHPAASAYPDVPFFHGEAALAGWRRVVEAVHESGGLVAPQLWHTGAMRGIGAPGQTIDPWPEVPAHTPSGLLLPGREHGHAMTQADIDAVVAAFAQAAADAQALGFDAVEVHGAHGYLIDQFFWEGTNRRSDAYGGSIAKRTRFAAEIIAAIRARVGGDFPIILRFSQWKLQDYGAKLVTTPGELEQFLAPLAEAGVDIFHCSTRRFWEPECAGSDLTLAGWTRKLSGKPSILVGSVTLEQDFIDEGKRNIGTHAEPASLRNLGELLARGECDLVAVGRSLIPNPDWPKLVAAGREHELRAYDKRDLETLV
ncbi:MAG: NADH:flavin oxidoreductase [Pseudomonadales bacterium]|nr:NADH:flavin oxidoreductase [Pseudomonadales bacterium]